MTDLYPMTTERQCLIDILLQAGENLQFLFPRVAMNRGALLKLSTEELHGMAIVVDRVTKLREKLNAARQAMN